MTRKSRLFLLIAAASLPMIAACSESPTAPESFKPRRWTAEDSTSLAGCGDLMPWGKAPCLAAL